MPCPSCLKDTLAGAKTCSRCNASLCDRLIEFEGRPESAGGERETPHPYRRFAARSFDYWLLCVFFVAFTRALGWNPVSVIGVYVAGIAVVYLWIPIEATLVTAIGTTPGKWLCGIKVLSSNGTPLSPSIAFKRAFLVVAKGQAYGIPLVNIFAELGAYDDLSNGQAVVWDQESNSRLRYANLRLGRCSFICAMFLLQAYAVMTVASWRH